MDDRKRDYIIIAIMTAAVLACLVAFKLTAEPVKDNFYNEDGSIDTSRYVVAIEDEPDTVDFQCTTIHYTVALNVFDRLVETGKSHKGGLEIVPSLAESWRVSPDGRTYTFCLRDGVKFSNGADLTSSDVIYTFTRLLTYPDSANRDIAMLIDGSDEVLSGKSDTIRGLKEISDTEFSITLKEPFAAYLAYLSMPGASIVDEATTKAAGNLFGRDVTHTIGTGPYTMTSWTPGKGMILSANPDCWSGAPANEGLDLRFMREPEEISRMFDAGKIDVLDLDEVINSAEYYYRGDIYQDRLHKVNRICTVYIAMNESVKPLDDVRVRKALQLALNRQLLLDAVYSGRGRVVNGLFPSGLYGYNPSLDEIPYDPDQASSLLAQAGYPDGFDLNVSIKPTSNKFEVDYMRLAASMWERIGVRVNLEVMDEDEFMDRRKNGRLDCFTAMWTADFNDPDNFAYTFFGSEENSRFRSICYADEATMKRVSDARGIMDVDARLREYRDLERKIVQEDAAWIPLFSRQYAYVTSERTTGFDAAWNGSVKTKYRNLRITETE